MSAATITQAQGKGLRHHFSAVRNFAAGLYAAHGGWTKPHATEAAARHEQQSRRKLMSLASQVESYSPNLSAELRNLASKG
jgi:hypothetical protein